MPVHCAAFPYIPSCLSVLALQHLAAQGSGAVVLLLPRTRLGLGFGLGRQHISCVARLQGLLGDHAGHNAQAAARGNEPPYQHTQNSNPLSLRARCCISDVRSLQGPLPSLLANASALGAGTGEGEGGRATGPSGGEQKLTLTAEEGATHPRYDSDSRNKFGEGKRPGPVFLEVWQTPLRPRISSAIAQRTFRSPLHGSWLSFLLHRHQ